MAPRLRLQVLSGGFAVCRLSPEAELPRWVTAGALWSVTRTAEELSVVCEEALVPPGTRAETGWRALMIEGPFDFALTGILLAVARPLAEAGIGIFAVSTFDTDYVLVKAERLESAIEALRDAGHTVLQR